MVSSEKTSIYIIAIVGIVAAVGIFVLLTGGSGISLSETDISGQAATPATVESKGDSATSKCASEYVACYTACSEQYGSDMDNLEENTDYSSLGSDSKYGNKLDSNKISVQKYNEIMEKSLSLIDNKYTDCFKDCQEAYAKCQSSSSGSSTSSGGTNTGSTDTDTGSGDPEKGSTDTDTSSGDVKKDSS